MGKIKGIVVNLITISRILILVPVAFIGTQNLIVYSTIWVSFSDFLDGFLARKWDVSTSFGKKLDQYADKIVGLFFLLYFLQQKQISFFFVSLLLFRELLILIFRHYKWVNGQSNFIGKSKTFFIYVLFIFLSSEHLFETLNLDIKTIIMFLVMVSSWFGFILGITKITAPLVYFIGTTGSSASLFKKAPGTISSFFACILLFIFLKPIEIEYKIGVLIILFIFHFSYFKVFLLQTKSPNDDPSIYTLDETMAIIVAWVCLGELNITNLFILFSLFRFFDILKPLGIHVIEKQLRWSAAFRNMADDILAIFYVILIFKIFEHYVA